GMRRRLKLIPFSVVTQPGDEEYDKDLDVHLAAELSGILAWAVRGCLDWQQNGLGEPTDVREASSEYIAEADPLGQFIRDRCTHEAGSSVSGSDLFKEYSDWCKGQDAGEPVSPTAFGLALNQRGLAKRRRNGIVRYLGLKIGGRGHEQGELGGFETVLRISRIEELHKGKPENHPEPS